MRWRFDSAFGDASRTQVPPVAAAAARSPFTRMGQALEASRAIAVDSDSEAARDVRRRERIYRRSLAGADALAAAIAVLVAIDVVGGFRLRPFYLLVAPLIVLAAKVGGLYDKDELVIDHSTLNELPRLLNLATMFALLIWLARHYVVLGAPTTMTLLTLWLLLAAGLVVGRSIARGLARRISPVERCLLVGRRDAFERLDHKLGGGLTAVAGRFRAFHTLHEGDTRATVEPQRWRVFAGGCRATRHRRNQ